MKKTFDDLTAIEYFQLEQERLRIYIVSVNDLECFPTFFATAVLIRNPRHTSMH